MKPRLSFIATAFALLGATPSCREASQPASSTARAALTLSQEIALPMPTSGSVEVRPLAVAEGLGVTWVVWLDFRTDLQRLLARRLDSDGGSMDVLPLELPIPIYDNSSLPPRLVFNNGVFLFAAPVLGPSIQLVRLSPTGAILDPVPLNLGPTQVLDLAAAPLGSGFVVAYRDPTGTYTRTLGVSGPLAPASLITTDFGHIELIAASSNTWFLWSSATGYRAIQLAITGATTGTPLLLQAAPPISRPAPGVINGEFVGCTAESTGGLVTFSLVKWDLDGGLSTNSYPPLTRTFFNHEAQAIPFGAGTACAHVVNNTGYLVPFDAMGLPTAPSPHDLGTGTWVFGGGQGAVLLVNNPTLSRVSTAGVVSSVEWTSGRPNALPVGVAVGTPGALVLLETNGQTRGFVVTLDGQVVNPTGAPLPGTEGFFTQAGVAGLGAGFGVGGNTTLTDGGTAVVVQVVGPTGTVEDLVVDEGRGAGATAACATDAGMTLVYAAYTPTPTLRMASVLLDGGVVRGSDVAPLPARPGTQLRGVACTESNGRLFVATAASFIFGCELWGRVVNGPSDDGGLQLLATDSNECGNGLSQVVDPGGWVVGWSDEDQYAMAAFMAIDGAPRFNTRLRAPDAGLLLARTPTLAQDADGGVLLFVTDRATTGLWQTSFNISGVGMDAGVVLDLNALGLSAPFAQTVPGGFVMTYAKYDATAGVESRVPLLRLARTRAPNTPVITAPFDGASITVSSTTVAVTAEPFVYVNLNLDGVAAGSAFTSGTGDVTFLVSFAVGSHVLEVVAQDSAGQRSPSSIVLFTGIAPDAGAPDAGAPDAGAPDAGAPDAGAPDAGAPDSGAPDSGAPDSGAPDSGAPDSGAPDSGAPDSGAPDSGAPDSGVGNEPRPLTLSVGCGCGAGSANLLILFVLLLRPQRGRSVRSSCRATVR